MFSRTGKIGRHNKPRSANQGQATKAGRRGKRGRPAKHAVRSDAERSK